MNPHPQSRLYIYILVALLVLASIANAQTIKGSAITLAPYNGTSFYDVPIKPDTVKMILIFVDTKDTQLTTFIGEYKAKSILYMTGYQINTASGNPLYMDDKKKLLPDNIKVFMSIKP